MQTDVKDLSVHPCFDPDGHHRYGRIHLAVAPRCNIQCRYCERKFDCVNESRPGVTSKVLSPDEAVRLTDRILEKYPYIKVAAVAGPGDALYNDETFEALREIHKRHPDIVICISTNGLLIEERMEDIISCGVDTATVTVNAVSVDTAQKVYEDIYIKEGDTKRARLAYFLEKQSSGIRLLHEAGIKIKINTVLIPGANDIEITQIAEKCLQNGADIMNIIPLIPCGAMSEMKAPGIRDVVKAVTAANEYLPQFTSCARCRADACGLLGEEISITV